MRENHSPAQNFFEDLLTNVGCLSVTQANTVFADVFGATPSQTRLLIHTAHAERFCHFDEKFRYVVLGSTNENKINKMRANTIEAFGAAYNLVSNIDDLKSIYRPYSGGDLRFRANDKNYEIFVTDEVGISSLLFLQDKYDDYIKRGSKHKTIKTEEWQEAYTTTIILFPHGSNLKKCAGLLKDLHPTFPYIIACNICDDLFGQIETKFYYSQNDDKAD